MKLGYACINVSLNKYGSFKTITVKSASKLSRDDLIKKLKEISLHNLYNTYNILQWNVKNNIFMYRLTSNMIPLATLNYWCWWNDIDIINICNTIKSFIIYNNIRISFHIDQFCVINSYRDEVFQSSKEILKYHNILSNMIGNDTLILHVGGVYGNKNIAMNRFIDNFNKLPNDIQRKIVLENDDKSYNVKDVLFLCKQLNLRMCIDFHHDRCLPSIFLEPKYIKYYMDLIISTWNSQIPKCHISSGRNNDYDRTHADFVNEKDFISVMSITQGKFDIMFECKCKELGVLKIMNNNECISR